MQQQTIETLRQSWQESALPFAQQEPLAAHTTFQIGGPAVFWCTPKNADQLRRTLALCRANGVRTYLLGNGSNTLFADEGYDGAVIDLRGLNFGPTAEPQPDGSTRLTASAGLTLGRLCAAAQQQGRAVSDAGVLPLLGQKRRPVGEDLRLVVTSLYAQGFPPVQLRRARAAQNAALRHAFV